MTDDIVYSQFKVGAPDPMVSEERRRVISMRPDLTARDLAIRLGCTKRTVQRIRKEQEVAQ